MSKLTWEELLPRRQWFKCFIYLAGVILAMEVDTFVNVNICLGGEWAVKGVVGQIRISAN